MRLDTWMELKQTFLLANSQSASSFTMIMSGNRSFRYGMGQSNDQ
jgi:hypothetical protein